jgi:hypothetical protein
MLRSVKSLYGYRIHAVDGDIGEMYGFLFDDKNWTVKYIVVDTSTWLVDRKVIIPPVAFKQPELEMGKFPVMLTKEEIKNSPDIEADKPVSLHHQMELHRYYWILVGSEGGYYHAHPFPPSMEESDPHLRSTREVAGYRIHALDGDIGHVDDFIVDMKDWVIRHMVADIGIWIFGRKVLISPERIKQVNWGDAEVYVDVPKDIIKDSPEYDSSLFVNG